MNKLDKSTFGTTIIDAIINKYKDSADFEEDAIKFTFNRMMNEINRELCGMYEDLISDLNNVDVDECETGQKIINLKHSVEEAFKTFLHYEEQ